MNRKYKFNIKETVKHKVKVYIFIHKIIAHLKKRAYDHDNSKLERLERELFYKYTPLISNCTYGSKEYKKWLKALNPALHHHHKMNRHHPEHFKDKIKGMNLIDIIEMLCDWKAATLRHEDGNIRKSIEINQKRFKYSNELKQIFLNTINDLDW